MSCKANKPTIQNSLHLYLNNTVTYKVSIHGIGVNSSELFMITTLNQGCGIAMPDSSDSYIEPAGQVDFPR